MSERLLCNGDGEIPENNIYFGDSQPQVCICPACRGSGKVEVEQTRKHMIVLIEPHGVWRGD